MLIYRIVPIKYSDDLSGTGAKLYGGRWNKIDTPAVYTSTVRSLAVLELLVHSNSNQLSTIQYDLITIELPDLPLLYKEILLKNLPLGWQNPDLLNISQELGTSIFRHENYFGIIAPSAILFEEKNIVINPSHKAMKEVKIVNSRRFNFDSRYLKSEKS